MLTFKAEADLHQLDFQDPAYGVIKELIDVLIQPLTSASGTYDFNGYGYLVLVEEGDLDGVIDLPEIDCAFEDVLWEGASMRDGFYYAIYLANDEFGIGFVIPDADWLKPEHRDLLDEMVAY